MYWFTFISILFVSIIQGFILRGNNQRSPFFLLRDCKRIYANKFPWLEPMDGIGDDDNEPTDEKMKDDVIRWDDNSNMRLLTGERYKSSEMPENDLVELTGQQVNLIAKMWYNYVLSKLFDDTKEMDNLEKMEKVKKKGSTSCLFHNINKFESTYHKTGNYKYFVWIPDKENSKRESDILACFVVNETDSNMCLYGLLINPMWTSENIKLKCLKNSISDYIIDNKTIDVNEFSEDEKNERIVLEWII